MASYTPPTITGYNASPPPDDGSESGNNEVAWDKHINKIGDPIKDFAEAIDSATTTAFTTVDADIVTLDGRVDVIETDANKYAVDSGAADAYVVTLSPAPASYTAGLVVRFKATNANTGASTINVNALGAKDIKMPSIEDPDANTILANGVYTLIYDGTQFQLQLPTAKATFANNSNGGPSISSTLLAFTQATLAEDTWEGVGPTGSGEPNIWTALDGIPSNVDWIECFCEADATNTAQGSIEMNVHVRANGSSLALINESMVVMMGQDTSGASTSSLSGNYIKIPVASRVFDTAWTATTLKTPDSLILRYRLTGYGYN